MKNLSKFIFLLVVVSSCTRINYKVPTDNEVLLKTFAKDNLSKRTFSIVFSKIIEPVCIEYQDSYEISPQKMSILLTAIAIHETSGPGTDEKNHPLKSKLSQQYNNVYGIKKIASRKSISMKTTEFEKGRFRDTIADFSVYYSYRDATKIFFENAILSPMTDEDENKFPRYRMFLLAPTIKESCNMLEACGYATDPNYSDLLYALVLEVQGHIKNDSIN